MRTRQEDVGQASDVGRHRDGNEDALLSRGCVHVVADGIGGHAAGEVASALAVQALGELADRDDLTRRDVRDAVRSANDAIAASALADPARSGMGTTLTGVVAVQVDGEPRWAVLNVGDSRTYRWHEGRLEQLTVDHSLVQQLVDAGLLTPEQARDHPQRNIITRSLGHDPGPPVDLDVVEAVAGQWFLVCSDGLTDELDDVEVAAVLERSATPQEAADALVEAALAAGGHDNVTVLVVGLT